MRAKIPEARALVPGRVTPPRRVAATGAWTSYAVRRRCWYVMKSAPMPPMRQMTVSYTHLTLPTIYSV